MSDLNTLFQQFLRERRYLQNITPKTVAWHEAAWLAFSRASGEGLPPRLTNWGCPAVCRCAAGSWGGSCDL